MTRPVCFVCIWEQKTNKCLQNKYNNTWFGLENILFQSINHWLWFCCVSLSSELIMIISLLWLSGCVCRLSAPTPHFVLGLWIDDLLKHTLTGMSSWDNHPLALRGQETQCVCKHSWRKQALRGNVDTTHTQQTHRNTMQPVLSSNNRQEITEAYWAQFDSLSDPRQNHITPHRFQQQPRADTKNTAADEAVNHPPTSSPSWTTRVYLSLRSKIEDSSSCGLYFMWMI